MHLFISHSTKDGCKEALELVAALEQAGHRCWVAPRDVKAGLPYPGQIVSAIENAVGLVLLVTPGANESPDVLQEVQLASTARKTIAPVVLRATAPAPDLRYYVGVRHQIAWAEAGSVVAALVATFGAGASASGRQHPVREAEEQRRRTPGAEFRDGENLPLMVTIPAGKFTMGSSPKEEGRCDNEGPQHEVTFAHPFALAKFPVTFEEWDSAIASGANLHLPRDEGWGRGRRPVINVSWEDAQAYIGWLNQIWSGSALPTDVGLRDAGGPYRLPSEAEWEYACRSGSVTRWSFGDDESQLGEHAWFAGNSDSTTRPVGEKPANLFGLHDMHGNVWEWVRDGYAENYGGSSSDGLEPKTNRSFRVVRGGCWNGNPRWLRSAFRFWYPPSIRFYYSGFRPARSLP